MQYIDEAGGEPLLLALGALPPTAGPDDVLPGTARARLTVVSRLPQVRPEPTCLATAAEAGWGWRFLPHAESC